MLLSLIRCHCLHQCLLW